MSRTASKLLASAAYRLAWMSYNTLSHSSVDARKDGWKKVTAYIDALMPGQSDPHKLADSALILLQTYEQGNQLPFVTQEIRVWR